MEQVTKQVLGSMVPQFEALRDRMQRLEDRYQQLGGATDEHIDDVIAAYLNDSDHFCDRVTSVIEDWADKQDEETPTGRIKRAVRDMIDSGDIVVNIDTV